MVANVLTKPHQIRESMGQQAQRAAKTGVAAEG